jgi:NAD+ diphosphatase
VRYLTFTGSGLERCAELRTRPDVLATLLADRETRVLPVWQARCGVRNGEPLTWRLAEQPALAAQAGTAVFLGRRAGQAWFALEVPGEAPPDGLAADDFLELRALVSQVSEADAALLAYARAMLLWQGNHRFCGVCGAPNRPADGGFVMSCSSAVCDHKSFPRIDPAVIVLVHRGDRCLLGRQPSWPAGRFSTIAGFVEPGESLEDAVIREVREETDIRVGTCRYLASQPWPFPAAMMLGFHAEALSEAIHCNDAELAEARWLTRAEIRAGAVRLPPQQSIAFRLIEAWFDAEPGPELASLGLDSQMFRRADTRPDFRPR